MRDFILMRALHVLGVVIWIGGVSMVTTVLLPAVRRGELGEDRLAAFHAFERRFVWQARACVLLVGLSGFYMLWRLVLWDRFSSAAFWWMHAMVLLWLLFSVVLFIIEPARGIRVGQRSVTRLQRLHWLLLIASLITVFGAVAGSHGWVLP